MAGHFAPRATPVRAHGVGALPMPAAYFRLLLRRFGRSPERAAAILDGTGVAVADAMAAAPEQAIQLWQQLRQLENLVRLEPAGWALELGGALQGSAHGTLGAATAAAGDLAEALALIERFAPVRAPYFRLRSATTGSRHAITVEMQLPLPVELAQPLTEMLLQSLQALVESALGEPMREGAFRLAFPAPPHAGRYADAFHAPVAFDAAVSSLEMPVDWLRLPCPFADPAQHRVARESLEAAERALHGPRFVVAQVERVLEGCDGAPPGAAEVAARLHLSRRSLVRRLSGCGTSFRELTDAHRRRRAEQLLADAELTIAEVGDRLGYTDSANFGRAVRRWFGVSPSALRARH